jgi:hypothetical protein
MSRVEYQWSLCIVIASVKEAVSVRVGPERAGIGPCPRVAIGLVASMVPLACAVVFVAAALVQAAWKAYARASGSMDDGRIGPWEYGRVG